MPLLLIGFHLITYGLSPVQFVLGNVFAEFFKTTVVMISDVGVGLAQLLSNLGEGISPQKSVTVASLVIRVGPLRSFPSIPAK